jgi:hypothetical protein
MKFNIQESIVTWAAVGLFAIGMMLFVTRTAHGQASSASSVTCTSATIPVCSVGLTTQDAQTKPQAVPQSLTKVAVVDAYLKGCSIYQPANVSITLQDNQASPVPIIPATTFTTATQTTFVFGANGSQPGQGVITYGYWAPNGFSISASGAGAYFQCAWRQ